MGHKPVETRGCHFAVGGLPGGGQPGLALGSARAGAWLRRAGAGQSRHWGTVSISCAPVSSEWRRARDGDVQFAIYHSPAYVYIIAMPLQPSFRRKPESSVVISYYCNGA